MFRYALRLVSKGVPGVPATLEEVVPVLSAARSAQQVPFDVSSRNFRWVSRSLQRGEVC